MLVLLVEDDPDSRSICRTVLEHYGHQVLLASEGAEAIDKARVYRPSLIFMDLGLPGMDGWEATRILKSNPDTRHIPLYVLSAHALPREQNRAVEAGCDGFVAKPLLPTRLIDIVRAHVPKEESKGGPSSEVERDAPL